MTTSTLKEAGRITADTLALAAKEGVQRALAARSSMTELTPEQTQQVSGAISAGIVSPTPTLTLRPPIIYGLYYPINPTTLGAQTLSKTIA
jgi:hypothetical protein